jgi:hypothetical protein
MEPEPDRIEAELAWPTKFQYSILRLKAAHTLLPGEVRSEAYARLTRELAEQMYERIPVVEAIMGPRTNGVR